MNDLGGDSISSLLSNLFREFGRDKDVDLLLRLSNRYVKAFSNSQIPGEGGVVSSIQSICRQRILDGDERIERFNILYSKLKESKETNPQTRLWMLYLLLTLKYQNKSVSVSSFSIPKLPPRSPYATPRKSVSRRETPKKGMPENTSSIYQQVESSVSLQLPIAESLLIQEIIVTFQGIDSNYFKYDSSSSMYLISDELKLPLHILNTVLRLLQIGTLYKRIRLMMDQTKSEEHGIIRNSVNDNVNKQLYQFYRFVISLEETNNQSIQETTNSNPFTLQKLVFQCEAPLQRLTFLYNILCCSINLRGGALASSIYNFTNHGNMDYRSLSLSLLSDINKFILKQSWEWAVNGRLLDIHAEFFVEIAIPPSYFNSSLPKQEFNQWIDTYHYRSRMIPSFFPPQLVNAIFNSGKSIHFIRDTLQDTKWSLRNVDTSILDQCSLDKYKPFETLLTSVLKQAQTHIIDIYKQKYHLFEMLSLLQQFYLLGAGDFYLEFISRVETCFLENREEISDGWFQEEFNNCVNSTSLGSSFAYISQHIHLNKLRMLSVFDIWKYPFFTIDKEPNLGVILSQPIMTKYEQIFSYLMLLRTQSLVLERMWIDQCWLAKELDRMKDVTNKNIIKSVFDSFNLLRVKIHGFLTTLQNFYYLHIVDKLYKNLITRLKEVEEFDLIIQYHTEFVNEICHYLCIHSGDVVIKQSIMDLVDISKKFVGIQSKLFDSIHSLIDLDQNGQSITVEMNELEGARKKEVRSTLVIDISISLLSQTFLQKMQQLIMKLRNPPKGYSDFITIASQLDFNYYYTES